MSNALPHLTVEGAGGTPNRVSHERDSSVKQISIDVQAVEKNDAASVTDTKRVLVCTGYLRQEHVRTRALQEDYKTFQMCKAVHTTGSTYKHKAQMGQGRARAWGEPWACVRGRVSG